MTNKDKIFDQWLVMEYQSGNKKAMSLLVKRWYKKMCRHSYWYTRDIDSAKDVVQDCWGIVIRKIYDLKDPASFGSWVMSIVTRKSIDWLRKNKRESINKSKYSKHYNHDAIDSRDDATTEPLTLVKSLIQKLPDEQKIVLQLFYLENFSINQISEVLKLAPGTIKSRLFHAREKLRLTLKERNYER